MKKQITVFRGDGIGPEITDCVLQILEAANVPLTYDLYDVGAAQLELNGELVSQEAYESFQNTKVLLKSPITTPVGGGFRSINVTIRNRFDLYANIRPAKTNDAVKTRYNNIDIITFRENTEDLYVGLEEQISSDMVYATKVITRKASTRIIRDAFAYAQKNGRKKVTCVHKANILKLSDGMFLDVFRQIAKDYPDIEATDMIVDNACMQLVMRPEQFDIMVMPNLYGDIISDLTSGLIGGLGLLPSCNRGEKYAMFEAVHGSAPDIAGKHIANPTALLLSACMMLEYLGLEDYSTRIRSAVDKVLKAGETITPDLGGCASTEEYRDAIIKAL